MKSLFENMLRKDKSGAGSANKHFQFGPDLETISERQSVSVMSFGEGTLFSFNGEENSFYEDQPTTYIGEAQRFSTRSNLQDVLENYTFEERERLAKFLEMEIFACHYNDNFSYFDTVEKLRASLQMISQTKLLWKKCTKSVIDLDKLKSYAGMNIREISLEDKKVEDGLRIEKSTMTFDQEPESPTPKEPERPEVKEIGVNTDKIKFDDFTDIFVADAKETLPKPQMDVSEIKYGPAKICSDAKIRRDFDLQEHP